MILAVVSTSFIWIQFDEMITNDDHKTTPVHGNVWKDTRGWPKLCLPGSCFYSTCLLLFLLLFNCRCTYIVLSLLSSVYLNACLSVCLCLFALTLTHFKSTFVLLPLLYTPRGAAAVAGVCLSLCNFSSSPESNKCKEKPNKIDWLSQFGIRTETFCPPSEK